MSNNVNLYKKIVDKALSDSDFMAQLISDPKGTLEGEGMVFPSEVTSVQIVQDTQTTVHFALPIPRGQGDDIFC